MNYLYVARVKDLPESQPQKAEAGESEVVLIRTGETVRAFQSKCPHAGAPLEKGAVCEGHLVCPWHKAVFDISNGAWREPLALASLRQYPVRVEEGKVYVSPKAMSPALRAQIRGEEAQTFVILGTGAAGSAAAITLRDEGFNGKLILIDREREAPYDRTALSKFVPAGKMKISEVPHPLDENFWQQPGVEVIREEVESLDPALRELRLESGETLTFDKLLLATGGAPQRPELPGNRLKGVHLLRSIEQADALLKEVDREQQLVIIGNSFIALELAAALRNQDIDVTVIARHALPFAKQFGEEAARGFRELHEQNGVRFVTGEPQALEGDEHVHSVTLKDGRKIAAQVVVFATGIKPVTGFTHTLIQEEDGSLRTNNQLEAAANIWAAGDIASYPAPEGLRRVEHWRVAQQQGRVAALNMLGKQEVFDRAPFFWTTHYGTRYEYLGHAESWDNYKFIGSFAEKKFIALYGEAGLLKAVLSCGYYTGTAALLLRMQQPITVEEAQEIILSAQG